MSQLIENIERLATMVRTETRSGGNSAARLGGLLEEIAAELRQKTDNADNETALARKLDKTGNGKDVTVTFSPVATRTDISSGEKLTSLWGKVARWLTDLKAVAFSGKAADLVQEAESRLVTDTEKASWNDKFTRAEVTQKDADTLSSARQYVVDRLAEIIGGSPAALDTLYEIAAALNNDPNFATTIIALLNDKADLVHAHTKSQITDFPASLPASGGTADRAGYAGRAGIEFCPTNASMPTPVETGIRLIMPYTVDSNAMLCFTVRSYKSYQAHDIQFSGYLYPEIQKWYLPKAVMIAGTHEVPVRMGIMEDGRAYVWIGNTSHYYGIAVMDVVGGHNAVDLSARWEIGTTDETPNVALEKTLYPNATTNQIPASLPANGGNADTVDGKHADEFVQKTGDQKIEGNLIISTQGSSYILFKRNGGDKGYIGLGASDSTHMLIVNHIGGSSINVSDDGKNYSNGKEIATLDNIPASLPANGGNADTVDNRHADEFMYIQGNNSPSLDGIPTDFAAGLIKNHVPDIEYNAILQAYDFGGNSLQLLLKGMGETERVSFRSSVNNRWRDLAFADNLIMEDKSGSIMATNTVMNMHGFGYQRNGFPANGSFISFGGLGGKYNTQIQGDFINGGLYFRTYNSDADQRPFNPWKKVAATEDLDQKADRNHTHSGVATMKAMYEFSVIDSRIRAIIKKGSVVVTTPVRDGGGRYTINHNLGHDNYVVILGTGRREGSDLIVKAGLIEQNAACFRVQTSCGDQFHEGGFYATILTF